MNDVPEVYEEQIKPYIVGVPKITQLDDVAVAYLEEPYVPDKNVNPIDGV